MNKYLIVGLGNIGDEYKFTRHNIGFEVADNFVKSLIKDDAIKKTKYFENEKLALVNYSRFKGKQLVIIKPTTYMNLSGKSVNYWMQSEKIPLENIIILTDDLALPFGSLRMKKKGSDGGHNGLSDIAQALNSTEYIRLRFGIGSNFSKGHQVDYVLNPWNEEEQKILPEKINLAVEMVKSFVIIGVDRTMSLFNNK